MNYILWHLPEKIKDLNVMSGPKIMKWNREPFLFIYLFIYWIPPYNTWDLMSFFLNTEAVLKLVEVSIYYSFKPSWTLFTW